MPQYLMIKAQLQARIQTAPSKAATSCLPSASCARCSTRRGLRCVRAAQLEASGVIYRADRRGWFVTPGVCGWIRRKIPTSTSCVSNRGANRKRCCLMAAAAVPLDVMAPLALQPFDQGLFADPAALCRRAAGMLLRNHCLPARVPELLRHDLNGSLTEIYQTHYDLIYTSMHLSFYPTSMPARRGAGVMEGRPALLLRRLNYDQHGRILDYDIEYWRHDSLRIEVDTH